jgi:uncharacterized protein
MAGTSAHIKGTKVTGLSSIAIAFIQGYQKFVSPLLHNLLGIKTACRSLPTCSEYAQDAIARYGLVKGMLLSIRRVINCQPFFKI